MKTFRRLAPFFLVAIFTIALVVLYRRLADFHYREVLAYISTVDRAHVALAIALTLLNYLLLTAYDLAGMRYIGSRITYPRIGFASFIAYALNNNVGMSGVVGSSLRYRLYTSWGVSGGDVARLLAFSVVTFWLGFCSLASVTFIAAPLTIPSLLHFPVSSTAVLGALFAVPALAYASLSLNRQRVLRVRRFTFELPSRPIVALQFLISSADWLLSAAVLHVLLPHPTGISPATFLTIYLLAQCAGVLSNLPGGVGVFEAVIVLLLGRAVPASALLGALLAYRAVYYLLPLAIAAVMLSIHELVHRREGVTRIMRGVASTLPLFVPHVLAFTTFVAGAVLLFSGATPGEIERLHWLRGALPLPIVELSHLAGSIIGVCLLLLARGLQRRLDAAYVVTVFLLLAGIAASLLKGLDYEEAAILAVMLLALFPCQRHFYRKSALLDEPFSPEWILGITLTLVSAFWLGLFSYKHVDYSHALWFHFSFGGNAPRFLRATVATAAVVLLFGFRKLLRPAAVQPMKSTGEDLERARAIALASPQTYAHLALLGDKAFTFSDSGRSFVMYDVEGRSWIAMGDPVGDPSEFAELAWKFREECDRHNGWPVFYEVSRENLPLYIDLGLTLLKMGEEARVPLANFSLDGGSRKSLRKTQRRLGAEGWTFDVVPAGEVEPLLPQLRAISDAWLEEKRTREKRFSLGSFDEAYLRETPVAVVRRDGEIVAFANMWIGHAAHELSVDLMRHTSAAPVGVMDFLFVELMLWGRREGYGWFNLGMVPLSGLERHALGPVWHRVGSLAFQHGENFYNFVGLRQYKEKFDPLWEPKYLATPRGLALPLILANVAALISGGLKGALAK